MSEIVFNVPKSASSLQSQVENLQTTLASLNQQVIILQEALQERDQKITELEMKLIQPEQTERTDNTVTLVSAVINLYRFFFPPGKEASA